MPLTACLFPPLAGELPRSVLSILHWLGTHSQPLPGLLTFPPLHDLPPICDSFIVLMIPVSLYQQPLSRKQEDLFFILSFVAGVLMLPKISAG